MSDIVQRKLSGVFMTVPVEVDFEHYNDYVESLIDRLYENDVVVTKAEIADRADITKHLEKKFTEFIDEIMVDYWCDATQPWDDANKFFREEIRIAKEQRMAKEKEAKLKAEAEAKLRRADAKQIKVSAANLEKAKAILKAAGLIE